MHIEPITLIGNIVRLEPLQLKHAYDLMMAGKDPAIWQYLPCNPSHSRSDMEQWILAALREHERGTCLPFAIIEFATERAVGSTRFMNIGPQDRRLEIGWTWLGRDCWRTGVNTESKYLMLCHAFDVLGAIRVQFKTDSRNLRSQRAIERIGAIKEGVLRNHMIMPDGYHRHSVYYSIIDTEWSMVRTVLEMKLRR